VIASGESVIGPLATAEPAIYWVNGTSNAIRVHESGTTATLFTNTSGGPLTAVAVAGGTIAWAEDKGIKVGGVLHLDQLNAIGAGPSATGVVPHSMQLIGSTVLGVAEDKGQGNADLFIYTGASTYDSFRQLTLPVGNAVTTSDGWVYAVANGALQGLSTGKVPATTAGPILPVIATNSVSAFFINGNKQVVKTVGVAIAPVANAVDAVELAADDQALFYFAAPPSKLYRRDIATTVVSPIAEVPVGANRLVATSMYVYYVVNDDSIVRCAKRP
jgi:hypothetical protein